MCGFIRWLWCCNQVIGGMMTVEGANLHKSCLLIFPLFLMTQVNSLPKNIQHMSIDPLDLLEPQGWNCNFGFWNLHSVKFFKSCETGRWLQTRGVFVNRKSLLAASLTGWRLRVRDDETETRRTSAGLKTLGRPLKPLWWMSPRRHWYKSSDSFPEG